MKSRARNRNRHGRRNGHVDTHGRRMENPATLLLSFVFSMFLGCF
jgi:hypothetical protein